MKYIFQSSFSLITIILFLSACSTGDDDNHAEPVPQPEVDILETTVTVSEGSTVELNTNISIPASYTLTYKNSLDLSLNETLSDDGSKLVISIPQVELEAELQLTLTATNGSNEVSDTVAILIENILPESEGTFVTSSQQGLYLVNLMDEYIEKLTASEYYIDGLIVSDSSSIAHRKNITLVDYQQSDVTISGIPDDGKGWKVGTSKLYEYTLITNSNSEVWLIRDNEFSEQARFELKEFNTELPSVMLWAKTTESITFRYIYLHNNTNFINGLIRAYQATSDDKYIELAEKTAMQVVNLINDDGTYMRQYFHEAVPFYTGMNQSILLDSVYNVAVYAQNMDLYNQSIILAKNHTHTTEGVWNHLVNSLIGRVLISKMDITNDNGNFDLEETISNQIPKFLSEINRLSGHIPYVVNPEDPRYYDFITTYHTYDLMLLSKLSFYSEQDLNVTSVFQSMIDKIEVNYGSYYANNTEGLLYMYLAEGFVSEEFANMQAARVKFDTNDVVRHISYLRATSALLYLHEHTNHPALDFKL